MILNMVVNMVAGWLLLNGVLSLVIVIVYRKDIRDILKARWSRLGVIKEKELAAMLEKQQKRDF